MKVKDLLAHLEGCDPDALAVVNSHPVSRVEQLPYYYDGKPWTYETGEDGVITKVKKLGEGNKVIIVSEDLEDIVWGNPEIPIETDALSEKLGYTFSEDHEYRREAREFWREHPEYTPYPVVYAPRFGLSEEE